MTDDDFAVRRALDSYRVPDASPELADRILARVAAGTAARGEDDASISRGDDGASMLREQNRASRSHGDDRAPISRGDGASMLREQNRASRSRGDDGAPISRGDDRASRARGDDRASMSRGEDDALRSRKDGGRFVRWRGVVAVAVAVVAVVVVGGGAVVWRQPGEGIAVGGAIAGERRAVGRETIAIADRGRAVAEAGAEVAWRGGWVEQRAGSVFYRVEPGGPFVVETPAGVVEVLGTCFRVEVEPMKLSRQHVFGAGVGAVVAAVAVITVYEGGVRVVNARGSVVLAPGERARVEAGGTPVRDEPGREPTGLARLGADASRAELAAQNEAAREQLALAKGRIDALEKQLAEARDAAGEPSRVEPTADQLAEWAKKCEIHLDAPGVFGAAPSRLDDKEAAEWGIAKGEVAAVDRALADLHGRARDEMREIYIAATGNHTVADELTAGSMFDEIFEKALPADKAHARQRLSRERAGLQPPPANLKDLPAVERALRLLTRLGTDVERLLGDSLGPARARELRKRYNGWPGMRLDQSDCEERSR